MSKSFASTNDTADKSITFTQMARGCYAFTAEGDPNTGVIIGDDAIMVVDAQATPAMAEKVIEKIREVSDKPIKHVVLTHYHAVRALGASAYGASEIIASDLTKRMIEERGEADWASEYARFPRLFQDASSIPGLTRPTMSFASSMSVNLGNLEVRIMHLGRGHTMGDVVVWVPSRGAIYSGDLVEYKSACYCGDGHLGDWPRTLDRIAAFRPTSLMPGRGAALVGAEKVTEAIELTRDFVLTLRDATAASVEAGLGLKDTFLSVRDVMDPKFGSYAIYEHCLPFNIARAYDEALGLDIPQIWTAERDKDLWDALQGAVESGDSQSGEDTRQDDGEAPAGLSEEQGEATDAPTRQSDESTEDRHAADADYVQAEGAADTEGAHETAAETQPEPKTVGDAAPDDAPSEERDEANAGPSSEDLEVAAQLEQELEEALIEQIADGAPDEKHADAETTQTGKQKTVEPAE
ncbi:glyoxylase-like metal-dependent hydrolase (beta-lactamase superfamily II) [Roseibium hamelinense]|uniref:Glyoxylase-like metal-dependent hydrolase (Beta-lactamase superfamily II) n=1 Tax=Roseibium hamelinense TaxID=150831 RepID=A0A562TA08_9HYPH|nr:MBL fold metallo-hydrolase [Roseibium hamelinense]TWI89670.1 glyoxylase-like metal-dependent hydrolase (beta-lactamase superfamily II) [Roseibium hamelinense]